MRSLGGHVILWATRYVGMDWPLRDVFAVVSCLFNYVFVTGLTPDSPAYTSSFVIYYLYREAPFGS